MRVSAPMALGRTRALLHISVVVPLRQWTRATKVAPNRVSGAATFWTLARSHAPIAAFSRA